MAHPLIAFNVVEVSLCQQQLYTLGSIFTTDSPISCPGENDPQHSVHACFDGTLLVSIQFQC